MSGEPARGAGTDLGGGFSYVRRRDGLDMVVAASFWGDSIAALMTTQTLDARDDGPLEGWLSAWHLLDGRTVCATRQVHGSRVLRTDARSYVRSAPGLSAARASRTRSAPTSSKVQAPADGSAGDKAAEADALWTQSKGQLLVVRAADCAPVWIADTAGRALALAHAGWRGVLDGVIENAVQALVDGGLETRSLRAAVGPHLQPCCFEIGPDVASSFRAIPGAVEPQSSVLEENRTHRSGVALNLSAAIVAALDRSGLPAAGVRVARACTRCRSDLFHSYRRNGPGGALMAAVGFIAA